MAIKLNSLAAGTPYYDAVPGETIAYQDTDTSPAPQSRIWRMRAWMSHLAAAPTLSTTGQMGLVPSGTFVCTGGYDGGCYLLELVRLNNDGSTSVQSLFVAVKDGNGYAIPCAGIPRNAFAPTDGIARDHGSMGHSGAGNNFLLEQTIRDLKDGIASGSLPTLGGDVTGMPVSNVVEGLTNVQSDLTFNQDADATITTQPTRDLILDVGGAVTTDADIDTAGSLIADTIAEHTAAAGVTVDGVLLKDSEVTADVVNTPIVAAPDAEDGLTIKTGGNTLGKFSWEFAFPLFTVDPAQGAFYLYAPTSGQGLFLTAHTQVGLITSSATGLVTLAAHTIKLYDEGGADVAVQFDPDGDAATAMSFGPKVTSATITATKSATVGNSESARTFLFKAPQGRDVSSGTNNDGHEAQIYGGAVGTGGTGGTNGGVKLGAGSTALYRVSWDGTNAYLGSQQAISRYSGLVTGNTIIIETFGSGVVSVRSATAITSITPLEYHYDAAIAETSTRTNAGAGTTKEVFAAGVTRVEKSQASTTAAAGAPLVDIAQESTHASGVGGKRILCTGVGTSRAGDLEVRIGGESGLIGFGHVTSTGISTCRGDADNYVEIDGPNDTIKCTAKRYVDTFQATTAILGVKGARARADVEKNISSAATTTLLTATIPAGSVGRLTSEISIFNITSGISQEVKGTLRVANIAANTAIGAGVNGPDLSNAVGHDGANWGEISGDATLDANSFSTVFAPGGAGDPTVLIKYTTTNTDNINIMANFVLSLTSST